MKPDWLGLSCCGAISWPLGSPARPDLAGPVPIRAPEDGAAAPVPRVAAGSRLGGRLLANARRSVARAAAALKAGQSIQKNMIDYHNRSASSLGTQLSARSFRQVRQNKKPAGEQPKRSGPQKKAWTTFFLSKTAFGRLSGTTKNDCRSTSRSLDAVAAVVDSALAHQREQVSGLKFSLKCAAVQCPWAWLSISWDETPMKLVFGTLSPLLREVARYWWRQERAGPWRLLSLQECARKGLSRHRLSGVLETMGIESTLTWGSWEVDRNDPEHHEFLCVNQERMLMPPRFLPTSGAGDIAQGLDDAMTQLDLPWAALAELLSSPAVEGNMQILVISLNADLAGPNNLVKHLWAERAAEHNRGVSSSGRGVWILLLDAPCQSHVLNRIQTSGFKTQQLVSKVYNTCFTLNNINRWALVRSGLVHIVKADLANNFFRSQHPPPQAREHNQRILEATYLRHRYTRSRDVAPDTEREKETSATVDMLLDLLNGDWRRPCFQHWCHDRKCPCGQSLDRLVDLVVPILERVVFEPLSSRTPSTSRWHTYGPSFEGGSLGVLLCQVLPRSLHAAGPLSRENDGDSGSDDWRELCSAKAKDAVEFFSQRQSGISLTTACVVTEPLEHLSLVLQHSDEAWHALEELLHTGQAVDKCLQSLFLMLQPPDHVHHTSRTNWQLDMITYHYGFSEDLADDILSAVMKLASQVWSRMY